MTATYLEVAEACRFAGAETLTFITATPNAVEKEPEQPGGGEPDGDTFAVTAWGKATGDAHTVLSTSGNK